MPAARYAEWARQARMVARAGAWQVSKARPLKRVAPGLSAVAVAGGRNRPANVSAPARTQRINKLFSLIPRVKYDGRPVRRRHAATRSTQGPFGAVIPGPPEVF